ncbi:hypothetical protein EHI8A_145780 [Entamoeba histolytica HM-1:IMSS-B]|uniref:Uncharacterized protein n=4 Tax=Entamoeba histolytica TaxID=5759 RepID=M3U4T9_ENTH1|nr:Hypothetical protein EHI5A_178180 [Entamoeba histolytica KU27]EMH77620.1 hypothetical protein EHI8A_145780 [Entamoeba histolytica HM-1:IMSS-B]EMS12811.1 hypothetical protein KM1_229630 [Entamoeba histolytica HM-3:IMSS]ENY62247.1 hypothetical protein EHI7A_129090 [Entamoeba histolytica HM-1:IMSS-A]
MSITIDDRIEACSIEDLSVDVLASYFLDLDGIEELCDDMKELYKKEQCATLGDDNYLRIMEREAELVEDIALTSMNFLREYKKVIEIMKRCSSKRRNETKPKKTN